MTPIELQLLIHYACSDAPFERRGAPAVEEAVKALLAEGLLMPFDGPVDPASDAVTASEYGRAHLRQLCALPFPRMAWVDSNGREV